MSAFKSVDDNEFRDEDGMPTDVRYIEIDDFMVARASYLTDDGAGETIVIRLVVTDDEGQKQAGHFSLCAEAAAGLWTAFGMTLMDCGIPIPDLSEARETILEGIALEAMERELGDGDAT